MTREGEAAERNLLTINTNLCKVILNGYAGSSVPILWLAQRCYSQVLLQQISIELNVNGVMMKAVMLSAHVTILGWNLFLKAEIYFNVCFAVKL